MPAVAFAVSLAIAQPVQAQDAIVASSVVKGRVANAGTGQYLANALIVVDGTKITAKTETDGSYRLSGLTPGIYTIKVSYAGLDTETHSVELVSGDAKVLDFELTAAEVYVLGQYIVAADREGSAKALQDQRMADNQKSIVAADSFGNIVDGNVGELMKNLPGFTIDYAGEDAGSMRFRGMDANLANVTMDGNTLATNPGSDNRGFSLRDFSVQNIEAIEVDFVPTPERPASSMGGSINFKTKSAFNQKGRRVRFDANVALNTAEMEFQKTPGGGRTPDRKVLPGFTMSYSEAFGKVHPVGVSFQASMSRQFRFNDDYTLPSGYSYNEAQKAENGGLVTAEMQGTIPSVRWVETASVAEKRFVGLNLDYKLSDSTSLYLYNTYTNNIGLGGYSHGVRVTAGVQPEGSFQTMISPSNTSVGVSSSVFSNDTKGFSVNPGVKHRFGDLEITYDGYFSQSEYAPDPATNYFIDYSLTGLGMTIEGISGNATGTIRQTAGPLYTDIKNYSGLVMGSDFTNGTDTQLGGKIDVKKPFVIFGMPVSLQMGGRYNEQTRDLQRYYRRYLLTGNSTSSSFGSAAEPKLQQFSDPYFSNKWQFDVPVADWLTPYAVYDYYGAHPNGFYNTYYDGTGQYFRETTGKRKSKEAIYAGYAMATAKLMRNLTFLGGVRYELTELTSKGTVYEDSDIGRIYNAGRKYDTVTPGSPYYGITDPWQRYLLLFNRVKGTKSYDKVFPNAQLKYEPLKNMIVRAAYSTNIGRPNFSAIMPGDTEYDNYNLIRRNNPKLKPQEGTNYDFKVEYYLPKDGFVALSLFRQEFDNWITTITTYEDRYIESSGIIEPWKIETPANVGTGLNQGFEVQYKQKLGFLAHALRNFEYGVVFSAADPTAEYPRHIGYLPSEAATPEQAAAYLDSPTVQTVIRLNNVVKNSANMTLGYNGSKFTTFVGAYWRDEFVRSTNTSTLEESKQASDLRVDLKMTYKVSPHWTAYLDWRNVTDVPDERNIFDRTGGYYTSGMFVNLGMRANF